MIVDICRRSRPLMRLAWRGRWSDLWGAGTPGVPSADSQGQKHTTVIFNQANCLSKL